MKDLFNIKVILGALVTASVLLCGSLAAILFSKTPSTRSDNDTPAAVLTILPAPSSTPRISTSTPNPASPTPEASPTLLPGQIAIGVYVQISGTDGEGLRLRPLPGLDNQPLFLGYDAEVFLVMDGPQEADDLIWWFLSAPYDPQRTGWAAEDYLTTISPP